MRKISVRASSNKIVVENSQFEHANLLSMELETLTYSRTNEMMFHEIGEKEREYTIEHIDLSYQIAIGSDQEIETYCLGLKSHNRRVTSQKNQKTLSHQDQDERMLPNVSRVQCMDQNQRYNNMEYDKKFHKHKVNDQKDK